ncbi:MAG: pimeloyl-ACP methyl ester carboxylesterase [Desulforhopalus sp.]|jgi:pimeloyl-ACP methyl ester carboxylesterase
MRSRMLSIITSAIRIVCVPLLLTITSCASLPVDQINLMPAPDVYGDGLLNPLPENSPFLNIPYKGILYATDRQPAGEGDPERYYANDRGQFVRLGVAKVGLGDRQYDWKYTRNISMLKTRTDKLPIKIEAVEEWGILGSTVPYWADINLMFPDNPPPDATSRFTDAINAQLALSEKKHVYIYVHGYKVVYENPVLIASELWHFMGYNGAFIAYAWPSTPSAFAYIKDSDTSAGYARNLRLLLEAIAEKTEAEQIHLIGYSNGTRLVTRALEQLALINQGKSAKEIYAKLRIHNVILVGSDLDRGVFRSYLSDGLLNVPRHMTIYMSETDKALGVSQFLTRRQRVGQMFGSTRGEMSPWGRKALVEYADRISLVNVTSAEGAGSDSGHGYFRSSPWVSSDVLMTLYYGLEPKQRGLIDQEGLPMYTFPPDFIHRLWDAIVKVDPEFAASYQQLKEGNAN